MDAASVGLTCLNTNLLPNRDFSGSTRLHRLSICSFSLAHNTTTVLPPSPLYAQQIWTGTT